MKHLVLTLALLPSLVFAHNFKDGNPVPLVNVSDKGELVLNGKDIGYQPWQSTSLTGKVFLIQHIAGRSSAKELNAPMIEAIKAAKLPQDKYQTVTVINSNDAIWGTSGFVKSSAEATEKPASSSATQRAFTPSAKAKPPPISKAITSGSKKPGTPIAAI